MAGGGLSRLPPGAGRAQAGPASHEWGISIATPARAAAAKVPMSAACTNGTDLRNTLRIDCPRLSAC